MRAILAMSVAVLGMAAVARAEVALVSPAEGASVEVNRPMFFWKNVEGVSRYAVSVDEGEAVEIEGTAGEESHLGWSVALGVGAHTWQVRGVGTAEASAVGHFNVESGKSWPEWAIGPFQRYAGNPLLTPRGTDWEAKNVYNPGFLFEGGTLRMLYRGQAASMKSQLGYAESKDGVTFERGDKPLIAATEPFESVWGCEDPRFYKLGETYYVFYTGNVPGAKRSIALCEATSKDGRSWTKLGVIQGGTKNGCLLCDAHNTPVQVGGKYVLYVGDQKFGVCYSEDLIHWSGIDWIDLGLDKGWVRPYEPCYAVTNLAGREDNIVLFIAGRLNGQGKWYYAISEVLFKKADTHHTTDRLHDCIFTPRETYESGEFKDCLWMNGIVEHDGQWWMYYGAGDRNIGLATAPVR